MLFQADLEYIMKNAGHVQVTRVTHQNSHWLGSSEGYDCIFQKPSTAKHESAQVGIIVPSYAERRGGKAPVGVLEKVRLGRGDR